jgi:hypothetical protein
MGYQYIFSAGTPPHKAHIVIEHTCTEIYSEKINP